MRTCAICGHVADDHIRREDIGAWWCAEVWACLDRAGQVHRALGARADGVQGGLW